MRPFLAGPILKQSVVKTTPSETIGAAKKAEEMRIDINNICRDPKHAVVGDEDDASWMRSMRIKVRDSRPKRSFQVPCTIFRVPENIRSCDAKAYQPQVVSIGPYQHGTQLAVQNQKWQCVRYLLSRHRNEHRAGELLDRCFLEMKALDALVRSCYSEDINHLDSHELAAVMLLDGCFIIHLLLKQVEKVEASKKAMKVDEVQEAWNEEEDMEVVKLEHGEEEELPMKVDEVQEAWNEEEDMEVVKLELGEEEELQGPLFSQLWIRNLVTYDLLKLENQIPFFIVQTLFNLLKTANDEKTDLVKLAIELFGNLHPAKTETFTTLPHDQVHHLLHLFHSSLVQHPGLLAQAKELLAPEWIPCAMELKRAGVKFRKKEKAGSFLDVTFKDGVMEIPALHIYDYTDSLFRNLIAFEQCYPSTKTHVTIYAAFMDCIIDTPRDVRLLHLKGIVVNRLSTDDAVADLFNKLCNQIHYASDMNYLRDLFIEVKKYHESRWHTWRAGLMRDYFSNPWAIISLIAAIVLLLLTIEQSFFSAYSYFFPPE